MSFADVAGKTLRVFDPTEGKETLLHSTVVPVDAAAGTFTLKIGGSYPMPYMYFDPTHADANTNGIVVVPVDPTDIQNAQENVYTFSTDGVSYMLETTLDDPNSLFKPYAAYGDDTLMPFVLMSGFNDQLDASVLQSKLLDDGTTHPGMTITDFQKVVMSFTLDPTRLFAVKLNLGSEHLDVVATAEEVVTDNGTSTWLKTVEGNYIIPKVENGEITQGFDFLPSVPSIWQSSTISHTIELHPNDSSVQFGFFRWSLSFDGQTSSEPEIIDFSVWSNGSFLIGWDVFTSGQFNIGAPAPFFSYPAEADMPAPVSGSIGDPYIVCF